MQIFNTLTRQKEEFVPQVPGEYRIYVCGPTVYNYIHIGNARPLIVFDTLRRYLEYRGNKVIYVSNITDIDDKLIKKGQEEGTSMKEVAQHFEAEYLKDAAGLNCKKPTVQPRATEHIQQILDIVKDLIDTGHAYVAKNGDVYFRVKRDPEYGKLSHLKLDDLESGSYGLQLVLDDAAQSLTARLSTGFGAEKLDLLTMNYGTEDGGAQLGVTLDLPDQLDAKATLDLHWAALETQPEALSDRPVGLFDLSEDELTALEKSIGAQIARLLYGEDMTAGETDAVLTGTWKMQVDLTPNLLDALNDALGLDLQMDDPTVMTMLVTFGEDGSYHMDYDAKALREELNALEDALCEKYPDQEALLKQAFAGLQLDVDGSSGTYTASNGILYLTQSGEDWEDILYYSVEDNKLYLTPPQDEESGDWGGMFGSEYPMVFERVD